MSKERKLESKTITCCYLAITLWKMMNKLESDEATSLVEDIYDYYREKGKFCSNCDGSLDYSKEEIDRLWELIK